MEDGEVGMTETGNVYLATDGTRAWVRRGDEWKVAEAVTVNWSVDVQAGERPRRVRWLVKNGVTEHMVYGVNRRNGKVKLCVDVTGEGGKVSKRQREVGVIEKAALKSLLTDLEKP